MDYRYQICENHNPLSLTPSMNQKNSQVQNHSAFLPALFALAQRAFNAAAILARPAADILPLRRGPFETGPVPFLKEARRLFAPARILASP